MAAGIRLIPHIPSSSDISGIPKIIRRAADSSNVTANVTLADDDTLKFPIGASEVWWCDALIFVSAANATMDFKCGWSGPASFTANWAALVATNGTLAAFSASGAASSPSALLTAASTLTAGTIAGNVGFSFSGAFAGGGTAGTIAFQWAQATSDAGALKLLANSILRCHRLA